MELKTRNSSKKGLDVYDWTIYVLLGIAVVFLLSGLWFIALLFLALVLVVAYLDGNQTVNSKTESPKYSIATNRTEDTASFDDVEPNDDEEVYRVVGTNYRKLTRRDIGYSDNFSIIAEMGSKYDKYAVQVLNEKGKCVGYLDRAENKFWHKLLSTKENGRLRCRGYIATFDTSDDETKYYGKVFLPEIEHDEDYDKLMNR